MTSPIPFGIGVDIADVRRFREPRIKENTYLMEWMFSPRELAYCRSKKHPEQHFAARFAAKEAAWKAMKQRGGFTQPLFLFLRDVEVLNQQDGQPRLLFRGPEYRSRQASVSLAHSDAQAIAVVCIR